MSKLSSINSSSLANQFNSSSMDSDRIFCTDPIRESLEAAMPWVGGYIAAASAACTLAMAADAFNVFRHKKLWLPCRHFSLNAASLTLLAVAMKLPMDLTTSVIYSDADLLAKFNTIAFLSTAMANFMTSLGSAADSDVLANVAALAILVATVAADVLLQLVVLYTFRYQISYFIILYTIFMLLLLATVVSLAVAVPTTKRRLESMYQEKHKAALSAEENSIKNNKLKSFEIKNQKRKMMKYWVMAETSSPQFVLARSVVCTTSALMCLLFVITLVTASVVVLTIERETTSPYRYTTKWILYIQTAGVAIGSIAPMLRWFVVVSFKCSRSKKLKKLKNSFEIESYWTQTLVDWRDSFSRLQIWNSKLRKYLHNAKWFARTYCIWLQIFTVLLSKLFIFVSALFMSPFFLCYTRINKFMKKQQKIEDDDGACDDEKEYVLLLDGEIELPTGVLRDICRGANHVMQIGRNKQPHHLINLLNKFIDFRGVEKFEFDCNYQISSPKLPESPNCWTLPVVTLTSIAMALPSVAERERKELLSSVREGLFLAKQIDKIQNSQFMNARKAAGATWVGVVLYMKWLEIDLHHLRSSKKVLEELCSKAEDVVNSFCNRENPSNWPANVVAANSMLRIAKAIMLLKIDEGELFEQISAMIADVFAASLTNLPRVITTMCHRNAIEKREKRVRKAFLLLGETERIVQLVEKKRESGTGDDEAACVVEEWRPLFQQRRDKSDAEHSDITLEC